MTCINCGGSIIGDGITSVMHCEFAEDKDYEFHEADATPVYCNFEEEELLADYAGGIEQLNKSINAAPLQDDINF